MPDTSPASLAPDGAGSRKKPRRPSCSRRCRNRYLAARDTLADLHGPRSLAEQLADPVGKQYLAPQLPWPEIQPLTSVEVALGRPHQPLAPGELAQAGTTFDAALRADRDRVARDDPLLGGLDPSHTDPEYRQRLLKTTHDLADLFSTALELATLATDRVVRVDGRTVPRENVPWIMGLHQDGGPGCPTCISCHPLQRRGDLRVFTCERGQFPERLITATGVAPVSTPVLAARRGR